MNIKQALEKLRDDKNYYGKFGQKFLSNSNIKTLFTNPAAIHEEQQKTSAFLVGGYFHTAILEPNKLKKYIVIPSATRNTKLYKEMSGGELCLLQHEVDHIEKLSEKLLNNETCNHLINKGLVEHEVPGLAMLYDNYWKGKADIINHDEKLVIDLKTTNDISNFRYSAKRYNYDSQAYIYMKLFGYDMLFIAIDKPTGKIVLFECSSEFYMSGEDKVVKATEIYDLFYKTKGFEADQYFETQTL